VYAALEDRDRTVQALERMAAVEPHHVPRILIQPEMRLVRDDPRIAALRSRFNLSPQ
jgi:hypothetical protein